jgi:glycosyltransferase involved in cell wall biosynthesis
VLITPLILAWNEAPNLGRTLAALPWAERIVVVDSGSTDGTLELLAPDPRVRVVHRAFDNHTAQWNFGVDQIETPWVLALDADYVVSSELSAELANLDLDGPNAAWFAGFRYLVAGKPLRGTLYPPRAVLFRKDRCRFEPDGHTQRLAIQGPVGRLRGCIDHDDRKPLGRWFAAQVAYAALEADKLRAADPRTLRRADRLRLRLWPAVPLVFLYTLIVKGCLLDGWRGWYYTLQRTVAEIMLALELLDRRLER